MIYRVVLDGHDIYGESQEMTLISPTVDLELNAAGSFDFTMPPGHTYYDYPRLLSSDVEVYEQNQLIFFGRIVEINTDLFNQKKIHCEGALAYLNDTIQRPKEWDGSGQNTIYSIITDILDAHNDLVPDNRKIVCDPTNDVDKTDAIVSRSVEYETTKDALFNLFRNVFGGYFFIVKDNGQNRLKWVDDLNETSDQPAQYALNITELEQKLSGSDITTAIIPRGEEGITVSDVNSGYDYVGNQELITQYGLITKVVDFNSVTSKSELLAAAQKWLVDDQFEGLSIEVDVAELSYLEDYPYQPFKLGQKVRCVSTPHGILNKLLPITKYSVNLDSAVKKITIGTQKKEKLTEITDSRIRSAEKNYEFIPNSGSGNGGTYESGGSVSEESTYDDTALKNRISALETWKQNFVDQDTVYDDTQVRAAITQIQNELGNVRFSINSTDGGLDATIIEE